MRNYLICIACSIVIGFLTVPARGQVGQIQGRVMLTSPDGTTVSAAGATIDVYRADKSGHYEAKTNSKGKFSLTVPFTGKYVIAVSMTGAEPQFRREIEAGRGNEYDFVLLPGDGRRLRSIEDIEALIRATERQQAEVVAGHVAKARLQAEEYERRFADALTRKNEILASLSPEALSSARTALKSLRKIRGATEIGVTRQEYSARLIDVKADVDEATALLPDNQIEDELRLAMEAFVDASWAWNETIRHDILSLRSEIGATLQKKYSIPVVATSGAGREVMWQGMVLTKIWQAARFHIDRLSLLLN